MRNIFIVCFVFIQIQLFGQGQIGKISIKLPENWKISKTEDKLLQIDYQKASARAQIFYLGEVNSEDASNFMVDLFKKQNVDPDKFKQATQKTSKIGKTDVMIFNWDDEMFLDSQNKTFVTGYQIYFIEYKKEKYYLLTTDYFLKEERTMIKIEFDNLVNQISFK